MSAKHTDGPWVYKRNEVSGDCDHIATVAWVEAFCVGRDCGSGYSRNYEHHGSGEADARLIAAAPELLEALQDLVDTGFVGGPQLKRAQAAIAKAAGSAQ